ncbi:MAG: ABC transporter permease [Candidatus Bipolaricaulia bacterium]
MSERANRLTARSPDKISDPQRGRLFSLIRNKKGLLGVSILLAIVITALLAPVLARYDPTTMHPIDRFSAPTSRYLLGTDFFGRDILSRIIYGYRTSLYIAFLSVTLAVALGGSLGVLAGYFGRLETLIMRTMDILFAFPVLLLAITIVVILGPGTISTLLAIGLVYTPIFSRTARGPTLAVKQESYIEAARALGASDRRIIARHILPNVAVPVFIQATISLATAIIFESSLSFLGLGTQPPQPSLGLMVSEGRNYLEISPWGTVFPGMAIALVVLGFNLFGDTLQELLNPQLNREG